MDAWATFWGWLLLITLIVFAGLAVVVAIRGFRDLRALLKNVETQEDEVN